MQDLLTELLQPQRKTAVVDIGANPIDGEPPYKPMLAKGLCTVVGFDPLPEAVDRLRQQSGPLETYLPYAVGDGSIQSLYHCQAPGMTSVFKPDPNSLSRFPLFTELGKVIETRSIQTRALDDVDEVNNLDFLKVDVQGAELSIFQAGRSKLANAVAIQTEVSFIPLYENQPTVGQVDVELRSQGFVPHMMAELKRWVISPMLVNNNPRKPINQLLEADLVYVRDFRNSAAMSNEQLKHLALVAHHCYRSFDLALFCIVELERRGAVPQGIQARYVNMLGNSS